MSNFKEIVTKAVVGKGKQSFTDEYTLDLSDNPSTILGCWVINHTFKGTKLKDAVKVEGNFDTNIWYSKDDNTKTDVAKEEIKYEEVIPIKTLEDYDGQDEIIIRMIKQPTCIKADIVDNKIVYTIEKIIAAEVVGDTKIKVGIEDDSMRETNDDIDEEINNEVKEDFLKEK